MKASAGHENTPAKPSATATQVEKEPDKTRAPPGARGVVASMGVALPDDIRSFMEPRFGFSFANVRIHKGTEAARSAAAVGALAYTVGNNIVFGRGRYQPSTSSGKKLLAHELTHVVQQQRSTPPALVQRQSAISSPHDRAEREADRVADQVMTSTTTVGAIGDASSGPTLQRKAARGEPGPDPRAVSEPMPTRVKIVEGVEEQEVQRVADPEALEAADGDPADPPAEGSPDDAVPAEDAPEDPTPAPVPTGTVTLSPDTLTRGDTLTATFNFDTSTGAVANVTAWTYTAGGDTVTRPTTEATFQTEWQGVMALSGTLGVAYEATPAGGSAATPDPISESVTVEDRTGTKWLASPTLAAAGEFGGQSSPPQRFNQLGHHDTSIDNATPTVTPIASGPNSGFSYVSDLTAGTYTSTPTIHPDVTTATSAFYIFHQDASRLYFVPASGTKALIPLSEYSNLDMSPPLTFDVPDWEVFYKAHDFFTVRATSGTAAVTVAEAWWGLDGNASDASIEITDEPALRTALGIPATDGYSISFAPNGTWEGYELLPSASIEAGTRGHEYSWTTQSHRANFEKMLRALNPQRKIEAKVRTPSVSVNFNRLLRTWRTQILAPNHEIVDEDLSAENERFEAVPGETMFGVNQDETTGERLGMVWNITGEAVMR